VPRTSDVATPKAGFGAGRRYLNTLPQRRVAPSCSVLP